MAYAVVAYMSMAYIVMACIVMACVSIAGAEHQFPADRFDEKKTGFVAGKGNKNQTDKHA